MTVDGSLSCRSCDFSDETRKDLRSRAGQFVRLRFPRRQLVEPAQLLQQVDTSRPAMTYSGPDALRDSRELMSEVSSRLPKGGDVLDLGCGPRDQFLPLDFLGFRYVGVDYGNAAADLFADAHAIPFKEASFDCVFSYAVIEHLHNPFIALHEIARVLKSGGWFIGTVSQGEPFHSSYFHHTPWALVSLVGAVPGLRLMRLWESADTLQSLASMGRYSRVVKGMLAGLAWVASQLPWLMPRKMQWPEKEKQLDRLYRAGSLCFSIQKVSCGNISPDPGAA